MPSEIEVYGDITLFGIRVEFKSDHADALNAVLASYSGWNRPDLLDATRVVYVVIRSGAAAQGTHADHEHVDGVHLDIKRHGISARADGEASCGRCEFPPEAAGSDAFLEAMNTIVLFLVAHAGRIPLHASAVMVNDTAIALSGRSGSGKSALALAADRAGLPVLSEDTVFVQTVPRFRLWSLMRAIHVLERDAPKGVEAGMRFRAGRWKKALAVATPRCMAERAMLCVLKRGDAVRLQPIGPADAVAELVTNLEPGYQFYGERTASAVLALARGGAWRLTLSSDPAEAVALLCRSFG